MDTVTSPSEPRTLLICFSHLRWDFVYQRPQHLLTRAAADYRVLYFEEPTFADCQIPDLHIRDGADGVRVVTPQLPRNIAPSSVIATLRELVRDLLVAESPQRTIAWYYTPMALQFTDELHADVCVYDNMDELSAFRGASPLLLELEQQLLDRASVVFTGGRSLFQAKRDRHANIHALPSSIDRHHFAEALRSGLTEPSDQTPISTPRIGFFGVIDERMDLDLVRLSAALRQDWQFVMIGPIAKIDPATLPQAENIHWLGQKSYSDLPSYLRGWQIAFMPFALNEATRFISPTKTPEFLAAGLRVISTAIPDVMDPYAEAGLVEIVSSPEQLVATAERFLQASPEPHWRDQVDQFLASNSWDLTWARMNELIQLAATTAGSCLPTHLEGELRV